MKKHTPTYHTKINSIFWLHLTVTILQWLGPFLFWWPLMCIAYLIVQVQFGFFKRCLMNQGHDLDDTTEGEDTFYAHLLEVMGFRPNRKKLKVIVRQRINYYLAAFTFLWQYVLGFEPLLF